MWVLPFTCTLTIAAAEPDNVPMSRLPDLRPERVRTRVDRAEGLLAHLSGAPAA